MNKKFALFINYDNCIYAFIPLDVLLVIMIAFPLTDL